jgi:putative ABC transport system permease protein
MKDYFFIASRNVRKRGIRSWLTMLGIFVGIAAVVSLISLGQGLQSAITGQFSTLSTDTLTVTAASTGFSPPGSTAVRKLTDHDLKIIESVPGIRIVIPRLLRVAKIEFNSALQFSYVASIPNDQKQTDEIYTSLNAEAAEGRLLKADDRGKVLLGDDFVSNDPFQKRVKVGSKISIQGKEFEVVGILKRASTFTLNSVVLMGEKDMKDTLNIGDEIDIIAVRVNNQNELTQIAEEIARKFRKDRNEKIGEEDFSVQTPAQSLSTVNSVLNVINIVVAGIAAISLLVGGIGIANTMFTSVLERTREIGVMKAIGAKNSDILYIFMIEAGLLGLIGGLIGAFIGLSLAFLVSVIANSALKGTILSINISYPLLLASLCFSLFIGIISGIIPALQASRLHPVEALRR